MSVLVFRPEADPVSRCAGAWIPYGALALAGEAARAGEPVRLLDAYHDAPLEAALEGAGPPLAAVLWAGPGHAIRAALGIAQRLRARWPGVPLLWAGPHPARRPEETAAHPLVDAALPAGAGTLETLLRSLRRGEDWRSVPGVAARDPATGRVRRTGAPLEAGPAPYRFDLLAPGRYVTEREGLPGRRIVTYALPDGLDAHLAAANLRELLDATGADTVYFSREDGPADPERIAALCLELRGDRPALSWVADAGPGLLRGREAAFWDRLARSGLMLVRLEGGGEASAPADVLQSCRERGILVECLVREGGDFRATVSLLEQVMRASPRNRILVRRAEWVPEGACRGLEDWCPPVPAPAREGRYAFLQRVHHYAWMTEELKAAYRRKGRPLAAFYANHLLARARWRLRFFSLPLEHWFGESRANRLVEAPLGAFSRLTGAEV